MYVLFLYTEIRKTKRQEKREKLNEETASSSMEIPKEAKIALAEIATRCMCSLLNNLFHFNYRTNIISVVASLMINKIVAVSRYWYTLFLESHSYIYKTLIATDLTNCSETSSKKYHTWCSLSMARERLICQTVPVACNYWLLPSTWEVLGLIPGPCVHMHFFFVLHSPFPPPFFFHFFFHTFPTHCLDRFGIIL